MAHDPERIDPRGTLDTLPAPNEANDAYSAETRVGTLPEHVLEAMRKQETDASLEKRTKSGLVRAAVRPLPPPRSPARSGVPTPRPLTPSGLQKRVRPPLPPPSPLAPLSIEVEPRNIVASQESMLAGTPLLPGPPAAPAEAPLVAPPLRVPDVTPLRRGMARSVVVIAVFAVLVAASVAALTLAGY